MSQGIPGAKGAKGDPGPSLRRQVFVAFVILALFCISTAYWQNSQTAALRRAQQAEYGSCLAIQTVVELSMKNVRASTALSPAVKSQALATDGTLLKNLNCAGVKP